MRRSKIPDPMNPFWSPIRGPHCTDGPEITEMKKADLHLHSNFSYDVIDIPALSPRVLYDRAVDRGMGFFTLTDHETIRGIQALRRELDAEFGDSPPIPVINGVEIKITDPALPHIIHVNVLGLDQIQMGQLARRRKSIDRFLDYCRSQGLYHAYNHPFWFEIGEQGTLESVTRLMKEFPVIELNAGRIPQLNHRTVTLAREFDKQLVATSDSHTGAVGRAYTLAPGSTPEEFLGNITRGNSVAVPHNTNYHEFMDEIRDAIELVFSGGSSLVVKRSFLRHNRLLRTMVRTMFESDRVMQPSRLQDAIKRGLRLAAHFPASWFILQQRKMNLYLEQWTEEIEEISAELEEFSAEIEDLSSEFGAGESTSTRAEAA